MTILITGADGFIGSHMVEHILATKPDWPIVCLCSWRQGGIAERLSDSSHFQKHRDRVRVITHDLTAPLSPLAVESLMDVTGIVHFAADSHVDRSIEDPPRVIANNVAVTVNALELARQIKPWVFVQISTDEVYGPAPDGYCHKEWDPIIPSNPYSASKAAQEAIAISYWRTFAVPVVITNTMNNVAERQSAEKFLPMIIRRVLRGETLEIHAVGDRVGSRYYLHARNHADAVCYLIEKHGFRYYPDGIPEGANVAVDPPPWTGMTEHMYPKADRPPRYNVVGEKELTNLELAQMVAGIIGKPLRYELVDAHSSRPGHDLRYALDGTKLADAGWTPPVPLEASIKKTVKWYLANPEWLET